MPIFSSPKTQELISPAKGSRFEINLPNNHKLPHFVRHSVTSKHVRYKEKRDFTHTARCCFSYTNKCNQGATREQFPKASKRAAAPLKLPSRGKKTAPKQLPPRKQAAKGGPGPARRRPGQRPPRDARAPPAGGRRQRPPSSGEAAPGREGLRGTGHPDSSCSPHPLSASPRARETETGL